MGKPRWTDFEKDAVRQHYSQCGPRAVAQMLGRTYGQVSQMAAKLGVATVYRKLDLEAVKRLHAQGQNDMEIAREIGSDRHVVGHARRRLGLPSVDLLPTWRRAAASQMRSLGLPSPVHLRFLAWRRFARESGWPEHLAVREVQIMNLLAAVGVPLSREQIAQGIGARWTNSRASLKCRGGRGSYLANLVREGLVLRLRKALKGQGNGHTRDLYCLGPMALAALAERAAHENLGLEEEADEELS